MKIHLSARITRFILYAIVIIRTHIVHQHCACDIYQITRKQKKTLTTNTTQTQTVDVAQESRSTIITTAIRHRHRSIAALDARVCTRGNEIHAHVRIRVSVSPRAAHHSIVSHDHVLMYTLYEHTHKILIRAHTHRSTHNSTTNVN